MYPCYVRKAIPKQALQSSCELLRQRNMELCGTVCKLFELHASLCYCMQFHGATCKLMKCHASLHNGIHGTECKLLTSGQYARS